MRRLHGILPILFLLLAIYQVMGQDCGPSKCRARLRMRTTQHQRPILHRPELGWLCQEFEFPWMVALLDTRGIYLGGGAIISPKVVITAKSVTDNLTEDQLIVRAGEWDLKTYSEQLPHVEARIRSIVRHPGFAKYNGANNVALLFLRTPLKFTQHIKPICLPPDNRNFDYSRCIF
uniref:Vitamin K-dependent protein C-like n=1 Tax=Drosophila rhopaloa TaxID=1041015 RepID=A0A6P4E4J9_DRORH